MTDPPRRPSDTQPIDVRLAWSVHLLQQFAANPGTSAELSSAIRCVLERNVELEAALAEPVTSQESPAAKRAL